VFGADGAVHFSTSPLSRKGLNLARDPRVVIHLDSGDEVVILHGEVDQYELEDSIADAYEAKYDYRPEPGEGWPGEPPGWSAALPKPKEILIVSGHWESKLVRCVRGAIHDVIVDVRPQSPTYMQWFGVELSA